MASTFRGKVWRVLWRSASCRQRNCFDARANLHGQISTLCAPDRLVLIIKNVPFLYRYLNMNGLEKGSPCARVAGRAASECAASKQFSESLYCPTYNRVPCDRSTIFGYPHVSVAEPDMFIGRAQIADGSL